MNLSKIQLISVYTAQKEMADIKQNAGTMTADFWPSEDTVLARHYRLLCAVTLAPSPFFPISLMDLLLFRSEL